MTDYGHSLLFGSFITPAAGDPERTVELAVLSEQAGLDLVTFQDHPYQPAFLDTWTLLSYVAARTGRVRLAANVTNLPLRPPAVLARSLASLDRLSGGRIELGLGAGAFWGARGAVGGGGRGRAGTRSRPWAAGGSGPARPARPWPRPSRSSARPGPRTTAAASGSTASSIRSTGPSAAPRPPTTWRSGSAPTSRACSPSPGGPPTAGFPRSVT